MVSCRSPGFPRLRSKNNLDSLIELAKSLLGHWPWAVPLVLMFMSAFTVDQQTVRIVTRFGKFVRIADAGLNFRIPLIESASGAMSLKVFQLDAAIEIKTEDNVLVDLGVAVQYSVMDGKAYEAFYRLRNPGTQIEAYVADAVRSKVPSLTLDALYENKDDVANAVEAALKQAMTQYGYAIQRVLIVDITPDEKVADAMNDINAARREQVAAQARAEAEKILTVTAAQANAEAMKLQGQGIADQRKAILDGLAAAVQELQASIPGVTAGEIMSVIMMTRYFDTLQEMAHGGNLTTIMLPSSPGALGDLREQIISALAAGNSVHAPAPAAG